MQETVSRRENGDAKSHDWEMDILQKEKFALTKANKDLEGQVGSLQRQLDAIQKESEREQQQFMQLVASGSGDASVVKRWRVVAVLKNRVKELEDLLKRLKHEAKQQADDRQILEQNIAVLQTKLTKREAKMQKLEAWAKNHVATMKDLKLQISNKEKEIEELKEKINGIVATIAEKDQKIAEMDKSIQENAALVEQEKEKRKKFKEQAAVIIKGLQKKMEDIKVLHDEAFAKEREKRGLTKKALEHVSDELQKLQAELQQARMNHAKEIDKQRMEMSTFRDQMAELQQRIAAERMEKQKAEEEKAQIQVKLTESEENLAKLMQELEAIKKKYAECEGEFQQQLAAKDAEMVEKDKIAQGKIEQLTEATLKKDAEIERLRNQLRERTEAMRSAQSEYQRSQQERASLMRDHEDMKERTKDAMANKDEDLLRAGESWRSKIEAKDRKIAAHEDRIAELDLLLEDKAQEIQSMKDLLARRDEEFEKRLKEFEEQIAGLHKQLAEKEKEILRLHERIAQHSEQVMLMKGVISQQAAEIDANHLEIARLKDLLQERTGELAQLRNEFDHYDESTSKDIADLRRAVQARDEDLSLLRAELERARDEAREKAAQVEARELDIDDLRAEISKMRREIDHFKGELDEKERELDFANHEIDRLKALLGQRSQEMTELRQQYASNDEMTAKRVQELLMTTADRDAEIARLRSEVERMKVELRGEEQKVEARDEEIARLKAMLSKQDEQIANLNSTIKQKNKDMFALKEVVDRLSAESEKLKGELLLRDRTIAQRDEEIVLLKEELARLSSGNEALKEQLSQKSREIDMDNTEIARLKSLIESGERALEDMKDQLAHSEENLRRKIADLEADVLSKKNDIASRDAEIQRLRDLLNASEKNAMSLQGQLDSKMRELERQGEAKAGSDEELARARETIAKRDNTIEELRKELSELRSELGKTKLDLQRSKDETAKRESELGQKTNEAKNLGEEVEKLKATIAKRDNELVQANKQLKDALIDIERIKAELSSARNTIQQRDNTIKENIAEIEKLRAMLRDREGTIQTRDIAVRERDDIIARLKDELSRTKDSLTNATEKIERQTEKLANSADELRRLRDENEQLKEELERLRATTSATISEKESALVGKNTEIDRLREEVERLKRDLSNTKDKVTEQQHKVTERQEEVNRLQEELEITRLKLKDSEQTVVQRNGELKVTKDDAAHLRDEIERLKQELSQRDATIALRDKEIVTKDGFIHDRDVRILALDNDVTERNTIIERLKRELEAAKMKPPTAEIAVQCVLVEKVEKKPEPPPKDDGKNEKAFIKQKELEMKGMMRAIEILHGKIDAAAGDYMRTKVTMREGLDLIKQTAKVFKEIGINVKDPVKLGQINELVPTIPRRQAEVEAVTSKLAKDHNDKDAIEELHVCLRQLMDTLQIATSEGTGLGVNLSLREAVQKVPLFDGVSNVGFFNELVRKMKELTFAPDAYIIKFGDMGDSMYFITKGSVHVELENKKKVAKMNEGAFFGEIAVLIKGKRTASIVAENFVEAYELKKSALISALKLYPENKDKIIKVGEDRLLNDKRTKRKAELSVKIDDNPMTPNLKNLQKLTKDILHNISLRDKSKAGEGARDFQKEVEAVFEKLEFPFLRSELQPAMQELRDYLPAYLSSSQLPSKMDEMGKKISKVFKVAFKTTCVSMFKSCLQKMPMFQNTEEEFKQKVMEATTYEVFDKGAKIINAGDSGNKMYFTIEGSVEVTKPTGERLGNLMAGEFFGENGFLDGAPRTANITALQHTTCCVLTQTALNGVLDQFPHYKDLLAENQQSEVMLIENHRLELRRQFEESLSEDIS